MRYTTDLDELVPAAGNNDGVLRVGAEADARNPLGVALLRDGVLAIAEGVPELDGAVARAGDDLAVVGREGDGENVVGVANEAASGGAGGELPKTEGLVPRGRKGVGAIRGDNLIQALANRVQHSTRLNKSWQKHTQSETMWEWPWSDRLG